MFRQYFYDGVEVRRWEPSTFRLNHSYLSSFCAWLIKRGYLKTNPLEGIEKPKLKKPLPRRLSKQDAERIIAYPFTSGDYANNFHALHDLALLAVAVFAGLRANELCQLKIVDVDLRTNQIYIHSGKGCKDRVVPIYFKLRHHLVRYLREKKAFGKHSEYFFTSRQNGQLNYRRITRIVEKVKKGTGIYFSMHQLRHTFASEFLDAGMDIFEIG